MKVLKENPLLEVLKHPPQLILVEMEKGLFTGTAHLADGKGREGVVTSTREVGKIRWG